MAGVKGRAALKPAAKKTSKTTLKTAAKSAAQLRGGSRAGSRVGSRAKAAGAAPNTVLGLDHLVLRVKDLAASIAFYRRVFGARIERQLQTPRIVQLRIGDSLLDLVPGGRGPAGTRARPRHHPAANLDHFAVRVAPLDHAALARRLAPYGIVPAEPAQRYGAEGYGPSIYFHDLDGNMLEMKGPATRPRIRRGGTGPARH